MSTIRPSLRAIRAIARADVTDRVRAGLGASVLVQPAILLFVLLAGVVGPSLSSVKVGVGARSVAVARDAPSDTRQARLLADVVAREPRFHLRPVVSPDDEVASERADTGVSFSGADELRVVVLTSRRASKVAAAELTDSLRKLQLEQTGATAPRIERTTLKSSGDAGRIGLASLLPFLLAFQIVSLFGEASIRLRGGKTDRSAEVVHVLPVHRLDLVLGRAAVGIADGIVRLGAMMIIAGALPLVPSTFATFSVPMRTLAVLAGAGLCQVVVATAGGTLLGAMVRTEAQENAIAAVVTLGLSAGFLALSFSSTGPLPAVAALIPYAGPISWARNAFFGSPTFLQGVLAIGVSAITATCFILLAARALDRDGVTLRET